MQKRVLLLASVASMIDQFNMDNIKILQQLGYQVDVACNFLDGNTCSNEKIQNLKDTLNFLSVNYYQIDFTRNVTNIKRDIVAYQQLKKVISENKYNFIHCHSPIGGAIGRIVAYVTKTKVIYTAHGFHFYSGAPIKNWMIYYPIEKALSHYTDILITITFEDYDRARKRLRAKKTRYIPGIGVDTKKFQRSDSIRKEVREELGLKEDEVAFFSVGELNNNKNHRMIIEHLRKINNKNIHYFIVGEGYLKTDLQKKIVELHMEERTHLLGFRKDVIRLLQAADVFVLPSLREGLNVSMMEAMSNSLPCICNRIRGNTDLIENGKGGYIIEASKENEWKRCLLELACDENLRRKMGEFNRKKIEKFSIDIVNTAMREIYEEIG